MEAVRRCYDRLYDSWTSSKRTHDFMLCPLKVFFFLLLLLIMQQEMAKFVADLRAVSMR